MPLASGPRRQRQCTPVHASHGGTRRSAPCWGFSRTLSLDFAFFPPNAIFLSQEPPRIEPGVPWALRLLAFTMGGEAKPSGGVVVPQAHLSCPQSRPLCGNFSRTLDIK